MSSSLKSQISDIFTVVKERSSGDELCIICPECGDATGNRYVNIKSAKTYCYRCAKGSGFFAWSSRLGYRIKDSGISDHVAELATLDVESDVKRQAVTPLPGRVDLPDGFTPLVEGTSSAYYKLIARMAKRKNLDVRDFVEVSAGYTRSGKWERFCIFPVTEYKHVVYYQGRTYIDFDGQSTKLFPSRNECSLGSKYWLYGMDQLGAPAARVAVVVESILNVLSLRKRLAELKVFEYVPVCVFKHSISVAQALKIARFKNITEVCILYDYDATQRAHEQASRLHAKYGRVTVAEMPAAKDNKKLDANDAVDLALEAICQRKESDDFSGVALE